MILMKRQNMEKLITLTTCSYYTEDGKICCSRKEKNTHTRIVLYKLKKSTSTLFLIEKRQTIFKISLSFENKEQN